MELNVSFKKTEAGIIPQDWESRPLLTVLRPAVGQVDPKEEPYRSMILVAPDHIEGGNGRLIVQKTAYEQRAISGKYIFSEDDIVYSKIRPYLRKAILADFPGLCSADMYPLRAMEGAHPQFLFFIILGETFSNFAATVSVRSGIPKINRDELAQFWVGLPPYPEQRAIAAALGDIDDLLASLDALIGKKRDIKQATMQQLLTGERRLSGFSKPWRIGKLAECLSEAPRYGINAPAIPFSDKHPVYIRITDISEDGRFAPTELVCVETSDSEKYSVHDGDLLLTRTGASVGKSYLYTKQDGVLVFAGFLIRVRPDQNKLNSKFLFSYMATGSYWGWVRTTSMRSGQPGINASEYGQLLIPLPEINEQTAIATILSDMDSEITALEARRDKTRALKQGMMQELLSGRIRLL